MINPEQQALPPDPIVPTTRQTVTINEKAQEQCDHIATCSHVVYRCKALRNTKQSSLSSKLHQQAQARKVVLVQHIVEIQTM